MFPGALLQHSRIIFPGLDSLRSYWDTADRRGASSLCAREFRAGAVATDPDISLFGRVSHVFDLAAVLQLN